MELPAYSCTQYGSRASLIAASDAAIHAALDDGLDVALVVPSHAWAQQRKLMLQHHAGMGVAVSTYAQWVESLWDVFGDGRRIISAAQRRVLVSPLIAQVGLLCSKPSSKLVDYVADFVEEAVVFTDPPCEELLASEEALMELTSLYARELELKGLVETSQAEGQLMNIAFRESAIIIEEACLRTQRQQRFVQELARHMRVTVLERALLPDATPPAELATREISRLRSRLYTGAGGLEATGAVYVGEAHGAHVTGALLVAHIENLLKKGAHPNEIAVLFSNTGKAFPFIHEALAQAGIAFETSFEVALARTGLGGAFCDFASSLAVQDEDEAYVGLANFASTPYSGIDARDARALQMHWRECAASTAQQRMADIEDGFARGNVSATIMKRRLEPLAQLIDASSVQRVQLMFENAKSAGMELDTLIDDAHAAEALIDYLEICEQFRVEPQERLFANLPVRLERSFGDADEAVVLAGAYDLTPGTIPYIILCDLDSTNYPMARQAKPIDALLAKFGISYEDDTAKRQRLMLLDVLEACTGIFTAYRCCNTPEGNELCQSALWEELMTAYRGSQDDDDLPFQEVPAALRPYLLQTSEAEVFFADAPKGAPDADDASWQSFARGKLAQPDSLAYLAHTLRGKDAVFSPTALEDYYRCPYRWFASRRVGYNSVDNAFDAASQGNLVHAVLYRFYKEFQLVGFSRVTHDNLEQALAMAKDAFDAQLAAELAKPTGAPVRTQRDFRICEQLRSWVLDIVVRDADFLPGFEPRYLELSLHKSTDVPLTYAGVPVRGKVDRIDVDARGNAVIIDYKLSGLSKGYGLSKGAQLPTRIQTDIYATLIQRYFQLEGIPVRVVGSVYRSYARNVLRGVYASGLSFGLVEGASPANDAVPRAAADDSYEAYLARVEDAVTACVQRLFQGDIAPNPIEKGACEYCKALSFCPRGDV